MKRVEPIDRHPTDGISPLRPMGLAISLLLGSLLLGTGAVLLNSSTGLFSGMAQAAEQDARPADKYDRSVSSVGKIKLNYYSASWARVFQDLTDTFEMELIADQMPVGRFSRNDLAEHTRKDAIRIINHEIELQGFRIVEKGRYLILLETSLRRPQMPAAPQAPAKKPKAPASDEPAAPTEVAARDTSGKPRGQVADSENNSKRPAESNPPARSHEIRQVSYDDSADDANLEQIKRVFDRIENWNESESPQVHLVRLKHLSSAPTAALLSAICGAQPQSAGRTASGLSGVSVVEAGKSNSLLVLAAESDLEELVELLQKIDLPIEPQAEFQIFRWRAAQAMDLETVVQEFSAQRKSLAVRALIVPCPRAHAIVVRALPQDLDEIEAWINKQSASLAR